MGFRATITMFSRYIGQKKYTELQGMLYDGALLLFSHDEIASGTDLAKLYIDTLNEAEAGPDEIHFVRISKCVSKNNICCDDCDS